MKTIVVVLVGLLVASNAWWCVVLLEELSVKKYADLERHQLEATRVQLMRMMPDVAAGATKEAVIAAAAKHTSEQPFEKQGCTWVGWVGLKFSKDHLLESVSPAWSDGAVDPCWPAE